MDSKSTQNQPAVQGSKRKRQISSEETEDAVNSILPKKRRESSGGTESALDDSGFADEDEKVFHPAFRGQNGNNGMEVARSPASSPSSPLGSNCLRGEVVIGGSQPKQSLPSKARNRRRIPKIRMKTRTVIVTRAVTVDTRVMILTQTKRVRRWWRSRVVPQSFSAPRWPRSRSTTRR